ncbi:MAG: phosphoglycerate dehydrogenase [Thermodesulfobacteriota bacterium]
MTKKKWTVYIPEFLPPTDFQRKILEPVAEIKEGLAKDQTELISITRTVDAIILSAKTQMTRTVIEACPNLKIIAKYGVGIENIDLEAATDMGIPVTYNPGANADAVATLTIGLLLAVVRRIQIGKSHIKEAGVWRDPKFIGDDITDSTVGIIGYGNIAKQTIRKLQGFDVKRIMVFTETRGHEKAEYPNMEFADLQHLLKESDFVSIHKSLTPKSRGLIGAAELRTMKKSAYLINTSRGGLVKEKELIQALRDGVIAGAALDVFEKEPPDTDNPLIDMENVVMTPHIGGNTHKTKVSNFSDTVSNVVRMLQGQKVDLKFAANPEVFK